MSRAGRRARHNVPHGTYGPAPLARRWLPPLTVDELRVALLLSAQLGHEWLVTTAYILRVDKQRQHNHP